MNRATRLAISAAVIGLALGLVAGMPPWPDRTLMVSVSLLLLASAAVAAMWALLTLDEGSPDEPFAGGTPTARIHLLDIGVDTKGRPALVYRAVADVETDDAEEAFVLSQNVERSWTENDGVSPVVSGPCRSTSVGDVVEIGGRFQIVEPFGFADVASLDAAVERAHSTSFLAYTLPRPTPREPKLAAS